ncbi:TetR family transcriptional regulator [Nocardia nova]|uniref:TetR family transcriptional regulator n=1 Tax=Nocardia nova TaxID=37330 RepID=A0A2S6ASX4_9NOCA|nr:TetR/AcrR family transcriptional regulator [Nocardia nova]PPJ26028.1 TetR family transcriptional regulator [Nocardia nova]PPJ38362.1 TetR family transcriptional regulator [Nocardia nova]
MSDVTDRVSPRSGRRAGESGTREAILDAARTRFAEVGFDKASIRSIAGAAGVDPALVHHYFGTKQQLFSAALNLPIDPELIRAPIRAAELDRLGETVVRTVVGAWDSSVGVHAVAAFRGVLAGGDAALARSFLLEVALKDVREKVDSPPGTGTTRVVLAASQMIGLLVARKILQVDPVASMPLDELAAAVGPTIQRYLTGELPVVGG